jgi:hypothetical protein
MPTHSHFMCIPSPPLSCASTPLHPNIHSHYVCSDPSHVHPLPFTTAYLEHCPVSHPGPYVFLDLNDACASTEACAFLCFMLGA